jgi:hypothetical protein
VAIVVVGRVGKGAQRSAHALEPTALLRPWARFALPTPPLTSATAAVRDCLALLKMVTAAAALARVAIAGVGGLLEALA